MAVVGTSRVVDCAAAGWSVMNETFTPMSGRTRESRWSKAMRTFTVAFWRSAVGTAVMTCAGIFQSG